MEKGRFLYQLPLDDAEIYSPWREVFFQISRPIEELGAMANFDRDYQSLVLAEIIRREWNSRFQVHNFRGDFGVWINAHGEFWHRTLLLIEKVFTVYPHFEHPAVWFAGVLFEREINGVLMAGMTTKTNFLKKLRNQNAKLRVPDDTGHSENPFEKDCTKALIDEAFRLASSSDRFRNDTYMPWLRSRMALASVNDRHGQVFLEAKGKFIQAKQGRKR
jgi:hypothetical protein